MTRGPTRHNLKADDGKCLHYYVYFIDEDLGLCSLCCQPALPGFNSTIADDKASIDKLNKIARRFTGFAPESGSGHPATPASVDLLQDGSPGLAFAVRGSLSALE